MSWPLSARRQVALLTHETISPSRRWRRTVALTVPMVLTLGLLAAPAASATAVEPIDGAQTAGDSLFPNVGNGGYDAKNYNVAIAWTPGETLADANVAGTSTMTATADVPLKSFSMDFEGMEIDSVTVNGAPAEWTRIIDAEAIKYKLVVTPTTPVSGTFDTTVVYHGIPESHTDADDSSEGWNVTSDGASFLGQPIGAMTGYPHNDTPSDKATYTFSVDIPATITNAAGTGTAAVASNGELVSNVPSADGTRRTWAWREKKQMASELAFISIGKYDVIQSEITLSDGRTIPEWSFMDSALSAANKSLIVNRRAQLQTIIQNLETMYGPYPGNSVGVVIDTVPSGINYALETQDRPFFPSANSVNGSTLIHELTHQWYGDNVSPKVWNDIWINEGMATWGPTYYNNTFGTSTTTTETSYFNSWNSRAATSSSWAIAPAGMTDSATLYDYQTYTRGAQMWEALRESIGDTAFFTFVKRWQSDYAGQSKGAAEFEALAEEISGRDLTAFFQDWIYDADKPAWVEKLDVSLTASPESGDVPPGTTVSYTLEATNTGKIPLATSKVAVDLSQVLAVATIDTATLPEGLTLDGSTLTWQVPATDVASTEALGVATATFAVKVKDSVSDVKFAAKASVLTLGGTCDTCVATLSVPAQTLAPTADPVIAGAAVFGTKVAAKTTGWASGTTFTYQWLRHGAPITGATKSSYVLGLADLGQQISVKVTGTKQGYVAVTKTSTSTAAVMKAKFSSAAKVKVTGKAKAGSTLKAKTSGWGQAAIVTYRWYAGKKKIGKNTAKLAVSAKYVGKKIRVQVTVSKPGYVTATKASKTTAKVRAKR